MTLHYKLTKTLLMCLLVAEAGKALAQDKIPFITAHSKVVDIRDGDDLLKGVWNISPEVKPDTYFALRSKQPKNVTFYTDRDSITFKVKPGVSYDFGIVIDHKDTAYTRVCLNTYAPLASALTCNDCTQRPDTIPFRLNFKNQVIIKGRINKSTDLDLLFDLGSNGCIVFRSALKESKGAGIRFNGNTNLSGMGGSSNVPTSSGNTLTIGNRAWPDIKLSYGDKGGVDGVAGYNLFDGRIIEINHERKMIIVHPALPALDKNYVSLPMKWTGDLAFFPATLINKGKRYTEWFSFDTGGSGDLFINSGTMNKHRLYGTMEKVGEDNLKGAGKNRVRTDTYVIPEFEIGGFRLKNMTADAELPSKEANLQWAIAGNDLLKRFNVIVDYRNDRFYVKPNQLFSTVYQHTFMSRLKTGGVIALIIVLGTVGYGLIHYRKRKRSRA